MCARGVCVCIMCVRTALPVLCKYKRRASTNNGAVHACEQYMLPARFQFKEVQTILSLIEIEMENKPNAP